MGTQFSGVVRGRERAHGSQQSGCEWGPGTQGGGPHGEGVGSCLLSVWTLLPVIPSV